jgi:hypothetical protein
MLNSTQEQVNLLLYTVLREVMRILLDLKAWEVFYLTTLSVAKII